MIDIEKLSMEEIDRLARIILMAGEIICGPMKPDEKQTATRGNVRHLSVRPGADASAETPINESHDVAKVIPIYRWPMET